MPLIPFDDDPQLRERHRVLRRGAAARHALNVVSPDARRGYQRK